jgi:hypothetical protein
MLGAIRNYFKDYLKSMLVLPKLSKCINGGEHVYKISTMPKYVWQDQHFTYRCIKCRSMIKTDRILSMPFGRITEIKNPHGNQPKAQASQNNRKPPLSKND